MLLQLPSNHNASPWERREFNGRAHAWHRKQLQMQSSFPGPSKIATTKAEQGQPVGENGSGGDSVDGKKSSSFRGAQGYAMNQKWAQCEHSCSRDCSGGSGESLAEGNLCIGEGLNPIMYLSDLVNNAGVGLVGPVESISIDDMKRVFETNFFGAVRMIKAALPEMKRRQSGHIVVISSVMGLQGVPFNDVYAASKFAVEGFCESLAVQLLKFNIFISLVEPGPVNTEFEMKLMEEVARSEFPGADPATVRYFKEIYLPASHEIFATMGQTPESVSTAVVNVIGKVRPPFRTQTNMLYTPLVALKYADTSGNLSVGTYYNLLFRFTGIFHLSMSFLRCITCSCCRRRITPA